MWVITNQNWMNGFDTRAQNIDQIQPLIFPIPIPYIPFLYSPKTTSHNKEEVSFPEFDKKVDWKRTAAFIIDSILKKMGKCQVWPSF